MSISFAFEWTSGHHMWLTGATSHNNADLRHMPSVCVDIWDNLVRTHCVGVLWAQKLNVVEITYTHTHTNACTVFQVVILYSPRFSFRLLCNLSLPVFSFKALPCGTCFACASPLSVACCMLHAAIYLPHYLALCVYLLLAVALSAGSCSLFAPLLQFMEITFEFAFIFGFLTMSSALHSLCCVNCSMLAAFTFCAPIRRFNGSVNDLPFFFVFSFPANFLNFSIPFIIFQFSVQYCLTPTLLNTRLSSFSLAELNNFNEFSFQVSSM